MKIGLLIPHILVITLLYDSAFTQWLSRPQLHRGHRRTLSRLKGRLHHPPYLSNNGTESHEADYGNESNGSGDVALVNNNASTEATTGSYNTVFNDRMIEILKKLGDVDKEMSTEGPTTTTTLSSSFDDVDKPEVIIPSFNRSSFGPLIYNGRGPSRRPHAPRQQANLWNNIRGIFGGGRKRPQQQPPLSTATPHHQHSIRRFDENLPELEDSQNNDSAPPNIVVPIVAAPQNPPVRREDTSAQTGGESEQQVVIPDRGRTLLDTSEDFHERTLDHAAPQSNANTLSTLAKLSPKKPIMIFMRKEGIMEAEFAGADPGRVVKKYAGSTKIQFFNGTVPEDNIPAVFLAPEDTIPPYGYGKIPIPKIGKKTPELPKPKPTYYSVEEQLRLLRLHREKVRLQKLRKEYQSIYSNNGGGVLDDYKLLDDSSAPPDFYDQLKSNLPDGAVVENIEPYYSGAKKVKGPAQLVDESIQSYKLQKPQNNYRTTEKSVQKRPHKGPDERPGTNAFKSPVSYYPEESNRRPPPKDRYRVPEPPRGPVPPPPLPDSVSQPLPPPPAPEGQTLADEVLPSALTPMVSSSHGIEIELPAGSSNGLISSLELQKIVGALVGGGEATVVKPAPPPQQEASTLDPYSQYPQDPYAPTQATPPRQYPPAPSNQYNAPNRPPHGPPRGPPPRGPPRGPPPPNGPPPRGPPPRGPPNPHGPPPRGPPNPHGPPPPPGSPPPPPGQGSRAPYPPNGPSSYQNGQSSNGQYPQQNGPSPNGQYPQQNGPSPNEQYPQQNGPSPNGQYPPQNGPSPQGQYPPQNGPSPQGQYPEQNGQPNDQYPPPNGQPQHGQPNSPYTSEHGQLPGGQYPSQQNPNGQYHNNNQYSGPDTQQSSPSGQFVPPGQQNSPNSPYQPSNQYQQQQQQQPGPPYPPQPQNNYQSTPSPPGQYQSPSESQAVSYAQPPYAPQPHGSPNDPNAQPVVVQQHSSPHESNQQQAEFEKPFPPPAPPAKKPEDDAISLGFNFFYKTDQQTNVPSAAVKLANLFGFKRQKPQNPARRPPRPPRPQHSGHGSKEVQASPGPQPPYNPHPASGYGSKEVKGNVAPQSSYNPHASSGYGSKEVHGGHAPQPPYNPQPTSGYGSKDVYNNGPTAQQPYNQQSASGYGSKDVYNNGPTPQQPYNPQPAPGYGSKDVYNNGPAPQQPYSPQSAPGYGSKEVYNGPPAQQPYNPQPIPGYGSKEVSGHASHPPYNNPHSDSSYGSKELQNSKSTYPTPTAVQHGSLLDYPQPGYPDTQYTTAAPGTYSPPKAPTRSKGHSKHPPKYSAQVPNAPLSAQYGPPYGKLESKESNVATNVYSYESDSSNGPVNVVEKAKAVTSYSTISERIHSESDDLAAKAAGAYGNRIKAPSPEYEIIKQSDFGQKINPYKPQNGQMTVIVQKSDKKKRPTVIIAGADGADMDQVNKLIESLNLGMPSSAEAPAPTQPPTRNKIPGGHSSFQMYEAPGFLASSTVGEPEPTFGPPPPQTTPSPSNAAAAMYEHFTRLLQQQQQQQQQQIILQQPHQIQSPIIVQQAPSGAHQMFHPGLMQQQQQQQQIIQYHQDQQQQLMLQLAQHQQQQQQQQAESAKLVSQEQTAEGPTKQPAPIVVPNASPDTPLPPVIFVPNPPSVETPAPTQQSAVLYANAPSQGQQVVFTDAAGNQQLVFSNGASPTQSSQQLFYVTPAPHTGAQGQQFVYASPSTPPAQLVYASPTASPQIMFASTQSPLTYNPSTPSHLTYASTPSPYGSTPSPMAYASTPAPPTQLLYASPTPQNSLSAFMGNHAGSGQQILYASPSTPTSHHQQSSSKSSSASTDEEILGLHRDAVAKAKLAASANHLHAPPQSHIVYDIPTLNAEGRSELPHSIHTVLGSTPAHASPVVRVSSSGDGNGNPSVEMSMQEFSSVLPVGHGEADRVLEKVKTEEKIVWKELTPPGEYISRLTPVKVTTQEKKYTYPGGKSEVETSVLGEEIAHELLGHEPTDTGHLLKRAGQGSLQPQSSSNSQSSSSVDSAFADLLKTQAAMEKMQQELHPKNQFLKDDKSDFISSIFGR